MKTTALFSRLRFVSPIEGCQLEFNQATELDGEPSACLAIKHPVVTGVSVRACIAMVENTTIPIL
jgi:hypothetical protein